MLTIRAAFVIASVLGGHAHAAIRSVTLQRPERDFGYFLGDTLTVTARIAADPNTQLDRTSLPQPGPVSRLIDIRAVAVSEKPGNGSRIYDITIQYQNFYGPDAATHIEIPGFSIEFTDGPARFSAQIPAWAFMASPLRHAVAAMTDIHGLQPDHSAPLQPDGAAKLRLAAGLAASLVAAIILLARGGWLPAPGAGQRPFTIADRRISRLSHDTDAQRRAFIALHEAFDATAGRTLLAGDVDKFLAQHGRFLALRPDIEHFFAASQAYFFGGTAAPAALAADFLKALTRRLARAERG